MKNFLLLLFTILTFSACQQQVAEVAYDLDSKSILDQTRNSQKNILYQSSIVPSNPEKILTFKGAVSKIEDSNSGHGGRLTLLNNLADELLVEVDMSTQIKIALNMTLEIRYTLENGKANPLEIKKVE